MRKRKTRKRRTRKRRKRSRMTRNKEERKRTRRRRTRRRRTRRRRTRRWRTRRRRTRRGRRKRRRTRRRKADRKAESKVRYGENQSVYPIHTNFTRLQVYLKSLTQYWAMDNRLGTYTMTCYSERDLQSSKRARRITFVRYKTSLFTLLHFQCELAAIQNLEIENQTKSYS